MNGARAVIGETAASDELVALLRGVSDAEIRGVPRFPQWDCRALAAAILGRSYAPDLLELCHLVCVAQACGHGGEGYERLFWGSGLARAANLRGFITQRVEGHGWRRAGFAIANGGITVRGADGRIFTVNYSRMPYLCAMMDFIVAALGFTVVDALLAPLFIESHVAPAGAAVSNTANAMARALHAFLKEHLTGQQHQRKFAAVMEYLVARLGDDFDPVEVDDEAVLSFWLATSGPAGDNAGDFRTFESVLRSFLVLLPALDVALRQARLATANPTGKDGKAGEIDPDQLGRSLAEIVEEDWQNPLETLADPPADAVKFLNKQEVADLYPLVEPGRTGLRLPLSVLRAQIWGMVQRRLTEALRGHADGVRLAAIIAEPPAEDYAGWLERYGRLDHHMDKVLRAALHALTAARSPHAASLALDLAPDLDPRQVAARFGILVPFGLGETGENDADAALDGLLAKARSAHKALNRQGFDRLPEIGDDLCDAFETGVPALQVVRAVAARMLRCLESMNAAGRFMADHAIFTRHLVRLYGEAS